MENKLKEIIQIQKKLEKVKPLYGKLDALIMELKDTMPVNADLMVDGMFIRMVDNFSSKNTVFKVAGIKRFDVVIETAEERTKRLEKEQKKSKK